MEQRPPKKPSEILAGLDVGDVDPLNRAMRRIRRTKGFPSISKYIVEINTKLAEHSIQTSASELANIITKDYALTNKLLELVNSSFFGFVAGKVSTVSRAVVLLGYDNVRMAAISLVLFEHFKRKSSARDLKNATISSFWCGLLAKEMVRLFPKVDPEEAFICAMLHQLGKLLVIYHMPLDYQEIKYRLTQEQADEKVVVRQVLGFSYELLGLTVAREWNFPESICQTMMPLTLEALDGEHGTIDPLQLLANFTCALCYIIDVVPLEKRAGAVRNLLKYYHKSMPLSQRKLNTVLASCVDSLYQHADALQFSVAESEFMMRLLGPQDQKRPFGTETDAADGDHAEAGPSFRLASVDELSGAARTAADGDDAAVVIMAGIQKISSAIMAEQNINDIALIGLEILFQALDCQRALLFIYKNRRKLMEVRYGYGAGIQGMLGKVKFSVDRPSESDLFVQAVSSSKDLAVDDTRAPALNTLLPRWYRDAIDAKAFVLMPLAYKNTRLGAYYVDLASDGPVIKAREYQYIAMLRNQVNLAIKLGQ